MCKMILPSNTVHLKATHCQKSKTPKLNPLHLLVSVLLSLTQLPQPLLKTTTPDQPSPTDKLNLKQKIQRQSAKMIVTVENYQK